MRTASKKPKERELPLSFYGKGFRVKAKMHQQLTNCHDGIKRRRNGKRLGNTEGHNFKRTKTNRLHPEKIVAYN
jgi:hypothetical protein